MLNSYLGHLLGHESGGSILSALKQKLWANGLSAGTYLSNNDFACFTLTVELSDEGVHHIEDITACIFAYIGTYICNVYVVQVGGLLQFNSLGVMKVIERKH